jgi:hypothetical protein
MAELERIRKERTAEKAEKDARDREEQVTRTTTKEF